MFLPFALFCVAVSGALAGGGQISQTCIGDSEANYAAQLANKVMNNGNDDGEFYRQVQNVNCVKSQVVEGIMYYIDFARADSTCRKTPELLAKDEVSKDQCPINSIGAQQSCQVQLWSRPWLNSYVVTKKECKETASHAELKMAVPSMLVGAEGEEKTDDPRTQEAARLASVELNKMANNYKYRTVAKINSAKSQVVAGTKWTLDFYWADTTCPKSKVDLSKKISDDECKLDSRGSAEKCIVVMVDRPWLKETQLLSFSCLPAKFEDFKVATPHSFRMVGGEKNEKPEDPRTQEAARLASVEMNKMSNAYKYRSVAKVISAKSQVVAGEKWTIDFYWADTTCAKSKVDLSKKITDDQCQVDKTGSVERCTAVTVTRAWIPDTQLLKFSCVPAKPENTQVAQSFMMAGGEKEEKPEDPRTQEAARLASVEMNKMSNAYKYRSVAKVISAKSQVVAGEKWTIDFYWADTTCAKSKIDLSNKITDDQCQVDKAGSVERCTAVTVTRAWIPDTQLLKFSCVPAKPESIQAAQSFMMAGGEKEEKPEDPRTQEAARLASVEMNKMSNAYKYRSVAKVISAKSQVVAGEKWTIDFYWADTTCAENKVDLSKKIDSDQCQVDETGSVERCTGVVVTRAWIPDTQLLKFACVPAKFEDIH